MRLSPKKRTIINAVNEGGVAANACLMISKYRGICDDDGDDDMYDDDDEWW